MSTTRSGRPLPFRSATARPAPSFSHENQSGIGVNPAAIALPFASLSPPAAAGGESAGSLSGFHGLLRLQDQFGDAEPVLAHELRDRPPFGTLPQVGMVVTP